MVESNSIHKCETCGKSFERKLNKDGSERKTKFSFCSDRCRNNPKRPGGTKKCARCGKEFEAKPNQIYCTDRCRSGTLRTRDEYCQSLRENSAWNFTCINCGKNAYRKPSATSKKLGHENKYCCMACRVDYAAKAREARAVENAKLDPVRIRVKEEVAGIRRLGKATYKPKKRRCSCRRCGSEFIANVGGGLVKMYCDGCLKETKRRVRRISKAVRRARKRSVEAESFDPLYVFERDGWKCRLCGVKTPKKKRGSLDDDAPELDHIIPISKGGPHTRANTQCSCRKCNIKKSDKPAGQLLMFG